MYGRLVDSSPRSVLTQGLDQAILDDPENEHSQGYGYYVWQGKHGTYRLEGMSGNLVYVDPAKELVLVFTSRTNADMEYMDLIWEHFEQLL